MVILSVTDGKKQIKMAGECPVQRANKNLKGTKSFQETAIRNVYSFDRNCIKRIYCIDCCRNMSYALFERAHDNIVRLYVFAI